MSDDSQSQRHIVVLGAGPAGLACAHELSRLGARVTVVERNSYVGGLCRTVNYKGYRFDLGGHRWFSKNPDLNNWFKRLMAGELVDVDRISRVFYQGTFYDYPIRPLDVIDKTATTTLAVAGLSYAKASIEYSLLRKPIRHIEDAFTAQFGGKLFDMFFRQYTEKVWGRSCRELSADWVSQRSKGLSIRRLAREAVQRGSTDNTSLIEQFMYPRYGYMRIAERLAEDVQDFGNTVLLNASVTGIDYQGSHDYRVHYRDSEGAQSLAATDVVSTIPLGLLTQMITPACDPVVRKAANGLTFRDLITVNLIVDREQVSPDTWLYVQNRDIVFGRIHEPKNWSPDMVPDTGRTSLVLECFCFRDDALWQSSDDEIAQRCIADLADQLGFVHADDVIDWTVVRAPNAYPIYDLEYADKIAAIRGYLDAFEGLEIAGRGGTFRYNNADHSIEMGLLLGQRLLDLGGDHMAVNTESGYQEQATRDEMAARPSLSDSQSA
ncbi:FAD-dependent oxidoreductase [Salinisphaera sp. SPP-AMP-43]|uniref:FAD-dependent oxidoreductase n=1 Tax=Salinisphaera sp. SPP-AMP-43 TaxID=3121288 RepID=UPI003C6E79FB